MTPPDPAPVLVPVPADVLMQVETALQKLVAWADHRGCRNDLVAEGLAALSALASARARGAR